MDCGVSCPVARASRVIAPSSSATPRVSTASGESGLSIRAVRLKRRAPSRSTVPASVAPRSLAATATRVTAAVSVRASICDRTEAALVERHVGRRQREVDSRLLHGAAQRRASADDGPEHSGGRAPSTSITPGTVVSKATEVIWNVPFEAIALPRPGKVAGDGALATAERDAGAREPRGRRTARGRSRDRMTGQSRRPDRP